MVEQQLKELRERYEDIPSEEDVEESLSNPETVKRISGISFATKAANTISRPVLILGFIIGLYIILVKFPATILNIDIFFLGELTDPILIALITLFGMGWASIGIFHLWGAWSFYRLRRLQNSPVRRSLKQFLRGFFILFNGLLVLAFAGGFLWFTLAF